MTVEDLHLRQVVHSDAERAAALAELRISQAELDTTKKRYEDAVARRRAAVWNADDAGVPKVHIARALRLKAHSNVDRLLNRHQGKDVDAVRRFYEKLGRGKAVRAAEKLKDTA